MTTVLSIDAGERVASMHSGTLPKLRVRRWQGDELPPCDVQITISRSLPPHLLRLALETAVERLCSTDDTPNVRSPYRRNAA